MSDGPISTSREIEFSQVDKITEIISGDRISAVKHLSGDEEYLQDHFPLFPVMPGVLMLEAMFQASAWLVRYTNNFAHSSVDLLEARNVKYQNLVTPGSQLVINASINKVDGLRYTLKTECLLDGGVAVNGRLVVETFNRNDRSPSKNSVDEIVAIEKRQDFEVLYQASN